jgi:hypothetical protein
VPFGSWPESAFRSRNTTSCEMRNSRSVAATKIYRRHWRCSCPDSLDKTLRALLL